MDSNNGFVFVDIIGENKSKSENDNGFVSIPTNRTIIHWVRYAESCSNIELPSVNLFPNL